MVLRTQRGGSEPVGAYVSSPCFSSQSRAPGISARAGVWERDEKMPRSRVVHRLHGICEIGCKISAKRKFAWHSGPANGLPSVSAPPIPTGSNTKHQNTLVSATQTQAIFARQTATTD